MQVIFGEGKKLDDDLDGLQHPDVNDRVYMKALANRHVPHKVEGDKPMGPKHYFHQTSPRLKALLQKDPLMCQMISERWGGYMILEGMPEYPDPDSTKRMKNDEMMSQIIERFNAKVVGGVERFVGKPKKSEVSSIQDIIQKARARLK